MGWDSSCPISRFSVVWVRDPRDDRYLIETERAQQLDDSNAMDEYDVAIRQATTVKVVSWHNEPFI